jgi:hypothetical protein
MPPLSEGQTKVGDQNIPTFYVQVLGVILIGVEFYFTASANMKPAKAAADVLAFHVVVAMP